MGFVTLNEAMKNNSFPKLIIDAVNQKLIIDGEEFAVTIGDGVPETTNEDSGVSTANFLVEKGHRTDIKCGDNLTAVETALSKHKMYFCEVVGDVYDTGEILSLGIENFASVYRYNNVGTGDIIDNMVISVTWWWFKIVE